MLLSDYLQTWTWTLIKPVELCIELQLWYAFVSVHYMYLFSCDYRIFCSTNFYHFFPFPRTKTEKCEKKNVEGQWRKLAALLENLEGAVLLFFFLNSWFEWQWKCNRVNNTYKQKWERQTDRTTTRRRTRTRITTTFGLAMGQIHRWSATHICSYLDVVDVDDSDRASYERHHRACHYRFY